jgi:hypothetical protein
MNNSSELDESNRKALDGLTLTLTCEEFAVADTDSGNDFASGEI